MIDGEKQDFIILGVALSLVAHFVVGIGAVLFAMPGMENFPEPIVYSVSMETGKTLGGLSNAVEEKKVPPAPPKKVSGEEPIEEPQIKPNPEVKPEDKVVDPPKEPEPDAEVSLAQQTPKPTAVPTKQPTSQPTARPEKKDPTPAPKATAAPSPKPQPTKKPKNTTDDIDKRLQQRLNQILGQSSDAGNKEKRAGAGQIGSGSGFGGPNVRPPEFFAYQKVIQRKVKDAWRWYDTSTSLITQITFKIDPTGRVDEVYVAKSSGNTEYDESVVRAVYKASPLPPPPESVYEFFKHVRITFDPREF